MVKKTQDKKTETIKISKTLWNFLSGQKDTECRTYESVIWRFIKNESGEVEGLEPSPPNNQINEKEQMIK